MLKQTSGLFLLLFTTLAFANSSHYKHHHTQKHTVATHPHSAPVVTTNTALQSGLNQIINQFSQDVDIGVIVQSTTTGKILYQRDATRLFTPASTLKLFTAAAALSYLGPHYTFATQLLTNAPNQQNGSLNGNLYLKFSGDPLLTIQDLTALIDNLTTAGIHSINGNIVIDDTAIDRVNWAPGWMWDEQVLCYAAPATSIILNHNCFDFDLLSGNQLNSPGLILNKLAYANIAIINQTTTREAHPWECPLDLRTENNNTYLLSGCIAPHHSPMHMSVALSDPRIAANSILLNILQQHGISITGSIVYAKAPANLRLLALHNSPPLSFIVTRMLKNSDDLVADVLFKKIGGAYFNTTGTWHNGSEAISNILFPTGVNLKQMVMVDGAGLSRYDLTTPAQLAKLLNYSYHTLPANNVFFNALPISGIDGTLQYRMGGTLRGKVHAKTGTMQSTSGLAGYIQTANDQTLEFAILINGFIGKPDTYRQLEDRICQFLAENKV